MPDAYDADPTLRVEAPDWFLRALAVPFEQRAVDVDGAGLRWLSPVDDNDGHRQLRIWREYAERELDGRPHPLMTAAFERVADELPSGGEPVLNWGDARLGNIIWRDFRPACLTDFEAAALAPPEIDVGWWLMFEQWSHAMAGKGRYEGELRPDEVIDRYDTSSLLGVCASGSALPGELALRWMNRFGDNLYNLYGSTEVAQASIATPDELRAAPGTAGRPPRGAHHRP